MKLGELADRLKALQEAQERVEEAKEAIGHGGSAGTMESKRAWLRECEAEVRILREEGLEE
jgi:hypothetical protein